MQFKSRQTVLGNPSRFNRTPKCSSGDEGGLGVADGLGQEVGGGADAGDVAQGLVDGEPVGADGAKLGQDPDEVAESRAR